MVVSWTEPVRWEEQEAYQYNGRWLLLSNIIVGCAACWDVLQIKLAWDKQAGLTHTYSLVCLAVCMHILHSGAYSQMVWVQCAILLGKGIGTELLPVITPGHGHVYKAGPFSCYMQEFFHKQSLLLSSLFQNIFMR